MAVPLPLRSPQLEGAIVKRTSVYTCVLLVTVVLFAVDSRAQSLPGGWSTTDVGTVGAAGSANGSGGSFTVNGAGADVWGTADAFRFVYTTLTGDGWVVADVTSVQ